MIARIFNQKYKLFVVSSLLLLGTLIYSNTLYSSFHFDDIASIVENSSIRNILNLHAIWNFCPARFITYLSVALNYRVSQLHVFSYHLFNLIIHLSSAILVWWFILLTFSTPAMKGQKIVAHAKLIAFFAGLVFITHPIQTQGVTYIIQRAASLATLFYLAAMSLYVKSRLWQQQRQNPSASRLFYYGSLLSAVVAMFTKETTITLPFMVLLYETCFLKTEEKLNRKYLAPFFATLLIIPLTMLITKSVNIMGIRVVSPSAPTDISPWQYLFTQFRVMVTYLRLLFIPINQNLDYDYHIAKSFLELPVLSSFILLLSILTIAIRMRFKYRLISFGIFWFFLTLVVESSIIPIRDVIFEHRLYLPMVGFSFFAVSAVYYIFENKTLKSMVIVLLIVTSCYAISSYRRNLVWGNDLTLWNDAVYKSPRKARPYNNRGVAYNDRGNFLQAIADYTKAIAISPEYAEAYYNRGNAYGKQGNVSQAIADYTRAIAISPEYATVYNNRGLAYDRQDNFPQAIADYTRAIVISPEYAEAYYNRGNAYSKQGNVSQAIADYTRAIAISPEYATAYNNRGVVYSKQDNMSEAIADYTKAIEINPDDAEAYYNRGNIYDRQGNFPQAIADYTRAIVISPEYAAAHNNRGVVYIKQGNFPQAIAGFTKAIAISPDFEKAYNNRGLAYDIQGNFPQAIADYTKAIEINPDYATAYNNRGNTYAKQNNSTEAIADYTKAIAISPKYAEAYYNRGLAYDVQDNPTEAIADYTKAIEINPNFANAYNHRGAAYYRKKEYDKAWADVHKAEESGAIVDPRFLEDLKKASGRQQ
jgi:tetratricopeptide (TPR) repeat protein